jgi:1-acyl-sn-glycerol-3-phosphate acyltransferase
MIFALNHQNALMDALVVLSFIKFQPVFLARQDVFKGETVKRILYFLKILPIYRIRDGRSNLTKNDEIFDVTVQVLRNKLNPIAIMPEGNHGDKRRLRPLVKGIFRMAFKAQEDYGTKNGVLIVPVGIDWSHYSNFRSSFLLNFGKPIEVSEYFEKFQENPAVATNELRDKLSDELSKVMIDIQSEEYYETFQSLRSIYNSDMIRHLGLKGKNLMVSFTADKEMIQRLSDYEKSGNQTILTNLKDKVQEYDKSVKQLGYRDWVLRKRGDSIFGIVLKTIAAIIFFPIFLVGVVSNYIPYKIPVLYTKKIKDPQFHSTFKYVLGIITFLSWYLVLTILVLVITRFSMYGILYLISLPFTGIFAIDYYIFLKKIIACWRFKFLSLLKNKNLIRLKELRQSIIALTDLIIKK